MTRYEQNPAVLPEGYQAMEQIDLKNNKKQFLIVNGLGIGLAVVVLLIGIAIQPDLAADLYDLDQGIGLYALRWLGVLVGIAVYMVLHELVHGICMKYYSNVKPHYGFTGMYAYAGSSAYFCRRAYIIIALAPVVVWGVVLAVVQPLVPDSCWWVVYFIQMANISGAGGDLYVTWKMMHMPEDILVNDTGIAMTVYSKTV